MKISVAWLREYVPGADLPPDELMARLTMIGLVTETAEARGDDCVLEVETYANRPDTLGHLGVAREVAAMLRVPLEPPAFPVAEGTEATAAVTSIQVMDEALCPRYCGLVVRGVKVGPSPGWLRERIEAMGLRPINNVVDVSNYVLFATGQPLHTFDFAKLAGKRIVVRRAQRGETLLALDGRAIELQPEMLVIADAERPVALAGVIGGEPTGVTEATTDVFIESATFDPVSVRLTSKRLGLQTDASYRFERGADIGFAPEGARMAASLLGRFGGRATQGVLDVYPKPRKPRSVVLRHKRLTELLGVEIPADFVSGVLPRLGLKVEESVPGVWKVEVPTFRVDLDRETDLVEEVARFYGYDKIPSLVTPLRAVEAPAHRKRERSRTLRQTLFHLGFDEVVNTSFADPEREALLASGTVPVPIRNPLSARTSVLRTSLYHGLLENAAYNRNRGLEAVHIFELGPVYGWVDEKGEECLTLGILSTGPRGEEGWRDKPRPSDFFDLKGAVESVMTALRYEPYSFEPCDRAPFEPGSALSLVFRGETVGVVGRVSAPTAAAYALEGAVFAAQVAVGTLFQKQPRPFQASPPPRFPAVQRDLSFLVDRTVAWGQVAAALERLNVPFLEGWKLVDRFAGPPLAEGKVSLSVRFRFRNPRKTLLAEEVDQVVQSIIVPLKAAFDIQVREG